MQRLPLFVLLIILSLPALVCADDANDSVNTLESNDSNSAADSTNALESKNAKDAKKLFDKGTELYESGMYQKAADTFREANRLSPNWKILFNIGQCEALSKRHGLALQAFEAYLSKGGDDVNTQREMEIRTEIRRLREMTGFLDINAPEGAIITVDDVERGTSPIVGQIPVAASVTHTVVVSYEDQSKNKQLVKVVGGQTVVVDFLPERDPSPIEVPEPAIATTPEPILAPLPKVQEPSSLRRWGAFALALSGGFMIAGTITGIVSRTKFNTLNDRCPNQTCTNNDEKKLKEEVDGLALATDILLPVGGILAITGIILLATDKKRRQKETHTQRRSFRVSLTAGGMNVRGSF